MVRCPPAPPALGAEKAVSPEEDGRRPALNSGGGGPKDPVGGEGGKKKRQFRTLTTIVKSFYPI